MPRSCAVQDCLFNTKSDSNSDVITSFAFPKDENLRAEWIKAINLPEDWSPTIFSTVCETHFKPEDFQSKSRTPKLNKNAVPSIFPSREYCFIKVEPNDEIEENVTPLFSSINTVPPVFSSEGICRCCMNEKTVMFDIFKDKLDDKLRKCGNIRIKRRDGLPEIICDSCVEELNISYKFNKKCEESDMKLRKILRIEASKESKENELKKDQYTGNDFQNDSQKNEILEEVDVKILRKNQLAVNFSQENITDISVIDLEQNSEVNINNYHEKESKENLKELIKQENKINKDLNEQNEQLEDDIDMIFDNCAVYGENESDLSSEEDSKFLKNLPKLKVKSKIKSDKIRFDKTIGVNRSNSDKPVPCEYCSGRYKTLKHLHMHIRKKHPDKNYDRPVYDYFCETCERKYKFRSKTRIEMHKATHLNEKTYICDECGKGFSHPQLLKRHLSNKKYKAMLKETGRLELYKPHKSEKDKIIKVKKEGQLLKLPKDKLSDSRMCEYCGKTYNAVSYATHIKFHITPEEEKLGCDVCGKKFVRKSDLKYHMSTHSDERPFECEICHKRFILLKRLNEHKKIHGQRERFPCVCCNKTYSSKKNLKIHYTNKAKPTKKEMEKLQNKANMLNPPNPVQTDFEQEIN